MQTLDLEAIEAFRAKGDATLLTLDQKPGEAPLDIEMANTEDTFSTPPQSPSEIGIGRGRNATNTPHATMNRKRVSPEVYGHGGSRKRSTQHIETRVSSSNVYADTSTLPESFTTFLTSVPSTLRTTNANNSFTTDATSTSFGGVQSPSKGDRMPARSDPTAIKREMDLHLLNSVKAEQPVVLAELEGEPVYPKLGHLRNKTSNISRLESQLYDDSPLCSY